LIFRGYNYNAPMAIILMMFKITMAWVSQFIQSVQFEKELLTPGGGEDSGLPD
jgi:hypothetical protein